jgi:hypothetical protein
MPAATMDNYKDVYAELVINQESQVTPAYVISLDSKTFPKKIIEFNQRKIPARRNSDSTESEGV